MRVAIRDVWVTVQGYGRSSAQAVLKKHGARAVQSLVDADVFGPEVASAVNGLTCPPDDAIRTYVTLAYVNDCLQAMLLPVGILFEHQCDLKNLNYSPLMPALKPMAEYYTNANPRHYAEFWTFSKNQLLEFYVQYATDKSLFGFRTIATRWSGLKVCAYAAILLKDLDYFTRFAEQVFLALFDKATALTGTAAEAADIRASYTSLIEQLTQLYRQYAGGQLNVTARRPVPVAPSRSEKPRAVDPPPSGDREEALAEAEAELGNLIGLPGVKEEVRRLMSFLKIQHERRRHGLRESSQSLHFVFTGNPGTGKTTVARILAKILFGFGILKTAKVVECDRSKLVGGYLGQTAIKTDEVIQSALDGVLFIDEAYALAGDTEKFGHGDMYGEEAVNTLLKQMEDSRDRLVVIAAGYPGPMERFLHANPGLESRFTRFIRFEDYSVPDLCRIFEKFCGNAEYSLTPEARGRALILFTAAHRRRDERFGNARFVRNVYERAVSLHSDRLARTEGDLDKAALTTLDGQDIPFEMLPDLEGQTVDLSDSRWEAQCPGCGKVSQAGVKFLGQRVSCKCGQRFTFPWWNLVSGSAAEHLRQLGPT